jgi:hypothetical protein
MILREGGKSPHIYVQWLIPFNNLPNHYSKNHHPGQLTYVTFWGNPSVANRYNTPMPTSPSYIPLHHSGELQRRAEQAECQSCLRKCRVN